MSDNNEFVELSKLRPKLQNLCDKKQSGRLIMLSENSIFFSFDFLDGEIVSIKHPSATGRKALAEIVNTVDVCKPVFTKATQPVDDSANLPATSDIIDSLVSGVISSTGGVKKGQLSGGGSVSDEINPKLIQLLTEYIGPMANIVGEPILSQSGTSSEAIAELSENIADQAESAEFLERAQRLLGNS